MSSKKLGWKFKDSLLALVLTLLVHLAFLLLFRVPTVDASSEGAKLASVRVLDISDPNNLANLEFINRHNPALFTAGSEVTGFSYVRQSSTVRGLTPPPAFSLNSQFELPKLPVIKQINFNVPAQPDTHVAVKLAQSIATFYDIEQAVPTYPLVELEGSELSYSIPKQILAQNKNLPHNSSSFVFEFNDDDSIPRIQTISSCGNVQLEQLLIADFLTQLAKHKRNNKVKLNIYWREQ